MTASTRSSCQGRRFPHCSLYPPHCMLLFRGARCVTHLFFINEEQRLQIETARNIRASTIVARDVTTNLLSSQHRARSILIPFSNKLRPSSAFAFSVNGIALAKLT